MSRLESTILAGVETAIGKMLSTQTQTADFVLSARCNFDRMMCVPPKESGRKRTRKMNARLKGFLALELRLTKGIN